MDILKELFDGCDELQINKTLFGSEVGHDGLQIGLDHSLSTARDSLPHPPLPILPDPRPIAANPPPHHSQSLGKLPTQSTSSGEERDILSIYRSGEYRPHSAFPQLTRAAASTHVDLHHVPHEMPMYLLQEDEGNDEEIMRLLGTSEQQLSPPPPTTQSPPTYSSHALPTHSLQAPPTHPGPPTSLHSSSTRAMTRATYLSVAPPNSTQTTPTSSSYSVSMPTTSRGTTNGIFRSRASLSSSKGDIVASNGSNIQMNSSGLTNIGGRKPTVIDSSVTQNGSPSHLESRTKVTGGQSDVCTPRDGDTASSQVAQDRSPSTEHTDILSRATSIIPDDLHLLVSKATNQVTVEEVGQDTSLISSVLLEMNLLDKNMTTLLGLDPTKDSEHITTATSKGSSRALSILDDPSLLTTITTPSNGHSASSNLVEGTHVQHVHGTPSVTSLPTISNGSSSLRPAFPASSQGSEEVSLNPLQRSIVQPGLKQALMVNEGTQTSCELSRRANLRLLGQNGSAAMRVVTRRQHLETVAAERRSAFQKSRRRSPKSGHLRSTRAQSAPTMQPIPPSFSSTSLPPQHHSSASQRPSITPFSSSLGSRQRTQPHITQTAHSRSVSGPFDQGISSLERRTSVPSSAARVLDPTPSVLQSSVPATQLVPSTSSELDCGRSTASLSSSLQEMTNLTSSVVPSPSPIQLHSGDSSSHAQIPDDGVVALAMQSASTGQQCLPIATVPLTQLSHCVITSHGKGMSPSQSEVCATSEPPSHESSSSTLSQGRSPRLTLHSPSTNQASEVPPTLQAVTSEKLLVMEEEPTQSPIPNGTSPDEVQETVTMVTVVDLSSNTMTSDTSDQPTPTAQSNHAVELGSPTPMETEVQISQTEVDGRWLLDTNVAIREQPSSLEDTNPALRGVPHAALLAASTPQVDPSTIEKGCTNDQGHTPQPSSRDVPSSQEVHETQESNTMEWNIEKPPDGPVEGSAQELTRKNVPGTNLIPLQQSTSFSVCFPMMGWNCKSLPGPVVGLSATPVQLIPAPPPATPTPLLQSSKEARPGEAGRPKTKRRHGGGWPKGKSRKLLSEPQPPKPPSTGYSLFMAEKRPILQKELGCSSMSLLSKTLGKMWGALSQEEREVFYSRAETDRRRYLEDLRNYLTQTHKESSGGNLDETLDSFLNRSFENEANDDILMCQLCQVTFSCLHNKRTHYTGKLHTDALLERLNRLLGYTSNKKTKIKSKSRKPSQDQRQPSNNSTLSTTSRTNGRLNHYTQIQVANEKDAMRDGGQEGLPGTAQQSRTPGSTVGASLATGLLGLPAEERTTLENSAKSRPDQKHATDSEPRLTGTIVDGGIATTDVDGIPDVSTEIDSGGSEPPSDAHYGSCLPVDHTVRGMLVGDGAVNTSPVQESMARSSVSNSSPTTASAGMRIGGEDQMKDCLHLVQPGVGRDGMVRPEEQRNRQHCGSVLESDHSSHGSVGDYVTVSSIMRDFADRYRSCVEECDRERTRRSQLLEEYSDLQQQAGENEYMERVLSAELGSLQTEQRRLQEIINRLVTIFDHPSNHSS